MNGDRGLGYHKPPDYRHVEKYPLMALVDTQLPTGIPVVLGIDWYVEFDAPHKEDDGRWWVAKDGRLTEIRGGHCICVKADEEDPMAWYHWYNQGSEGACVGFGVARMKSLLDRHRYNAFELYHSVRTINHYSFPSGAYVRDGLEMARVRGLVHGVTTAHQPDPRSRISAYRWTTDVQEIIRVIDMPIAKRLGAVPLLNSWGPFYPHIVWMPGEVLQRLINDGGEAAIVTDL